MASKIGIDTISAVYRRLKALNFGSRFSTSYGISVALTGVGALATRGGSRGKAPVRGEGGELVWGGGAVGAAVDVVVVVVVVGAGLSVGAFVDIAACPGRWTDVFGGISD